MAEISSEYAANILRKEKRDVRDRRAAYRYESIGKEFAPQAREHALAMIAVCDAQIAALDAAIEILGFAKPRTHTEAASALGRKGGVVGGAKRAERLSPERRSEIAKAAARKRWGANA